MNGDSIVEVRERIAALEARFNSQEREQGRRLQELESSVGAMRAELHTLSTRLAVIVALASVGGGAAAQILPTLFH